MCGYEPLLLGAALSGRKTLNWGKRMNDEGDSLEFFVFFVNNMRKPKSTPKIRTL